ncbi:hypothetical protein [Nannocystis pusilla]|uniref:hypothetical protein n=1 Tax=Nannocystis pusilla TaxID=889268 RepID=UPI003B7C715D
MMLENLTSFAFPHLAQWIEESADVRTDDPDLQVQSFPRSCVLRCSPTSLRSCVIAKIAALANRTDAEARLMKDMGVTVIPTTWTRPGEQSAEADVAAATGQLAALLAAQLGVPAGKVAEALTTPEAQECLGDLSEAWVTASDLHLDNDEDDEYDDEGEDGEEEDAGEENAH